MATITVTPSYTNNGVTCMGTPTIFTITVNPTPTWYADTDNDGFGDPAVTQQACTQPVGYVANNTDGCPTDPNKGSPGNCGCFVPESACTSGCADTDAANYSADPNARFAVCLYCDETQDFNGAVTTALTQAPGTWYQDRYRPFGFQGGVTVAGRTALKHSIDASDCFSCRPAPYANDAFYNTQGRKYDLPAETKEMKIDLYVPADWQSTGRRMAGFWATAVDAAETILSYPILEFTSTTGDPDGSGPRFRFWNGSGWTFMGLPAGFAYDAWHTLRIALLPSGEFLFEVDGTLRRTSTTFAGQSLVRLKDVILQGHNTAAPGVTYDIHWDDLRYYHEDTDTDGDGLGDACDTCPLDAFNDADGDGLCANVDNCPNLFGVQGDACVDPDPLTINDVITSACVCAGVPYVDLNARVVLEAAYDAGTGLMRDQLRTLAAFPLNEPYSDLGFASVPASSTTSGVLAVTGNNAIVDWVLLELRSSSNSASVLHRRAALLQRDGDVVDVDGTSPVRFVGAAHASYFVAVRHRNHLGAMTFGTVALSNTPVPVDFSSSSTATYGTNARKPLSGAFATQALWAGNAYVDDRLRYTNINNDRDAMLVYLIQTYPEQNNNAPANATSVVTNVYTTHDVTMDGNVKYTNANNDRDPILINTNFGLSGTSTTRQRLEQLP